MLSLKNLFILMSGLAIIMLANAQAQAATFCVVGQSTPPQCLYDDVKSCNAATTSETYCDINPAVPLMYYGSAKYCVVQADRVAQCLYADRSQCRSNGREEGVCIDRDALPDDISPYRYDNRIQN